MKNLRPETMGILERVQVLSGRPVEFRPDSSLTLRATLQLARNGAPAHVLRYRPSNDPLDYWVAYQSGYALRLFELPPQERLDFVGTGRGIEEVEALVTTGQRLTETDKADVHEFVRVTLHWALLNLRSFAIGMRIDQWIAEEYPALKEAQKAGVDSLQQENLRILSQRVGNLTVPVPLLAPVLFGSSGWTLFRAVRYAWILDKTKIVSEWGEELAAIPHHVSLVTTRPAFEEKLLAAIRRARLEHS